MSKGPLTCVTKVSPHWLPLGLYMACANHQPHLTPPPPPPPCLASTNVVLDYYTYLTFPDIPKKFITLLLERQTDKNDHKTLMGILEYFRRLKPHRDNFIQRLTCDEAQAVLVQTSIQESTKRPNSTAAATKSQEPLKEEAGQSAADPKVMCPGTVEKYVCTSFSLSRSCWTR